ncbi:AfsR/SARP family transcriptional regulator [Nonomuraea jiangxiensis]|uniref:DNA-binding transcriptional activator of the SARP family n=1 Tax=Nonomuraea jiangxiensis TaxID=633440 RepID=A0A1G9QVB7_9ACTN|nr:BTAD domain-containing putative transcriptional regulator [Nonomuraea jiangxiensis]SDM14956.1 DNA-binding transcriptional activator of the SARP family [Nonomuraea jiangxiensis]
MTLAASGRVNGRAGQQPRMETSSPDGATTRFGFLGAVTLWQGAQEIQLSTKRSRTVMARLLLSPGRLVSVEALVDGLYGEYPTKSARNQVQRGIWELRKQGVLILERDGSYRLEASAEAIDAWRFKNLTEAAGTTVRPGEKVRLLRDALRIWRGPALAGLDSDVFRMAAEEWEERRLTAVQDRIGADLALGRHDELIPELRRLTGEHPLRERFSWQLMVACYQAGRAGEAIAAYTALRAELADQLGIDPSPELRRLYEQILRQEPVLDAEEPAPRQLPPRPVRIIGREPELERIQTAFDRGGRAVAITGAPGSGKSTLALEVAHRWAESFPDGQLYSAEPEGALPSMLRALCGGDVPARQDECSGRLRTLLATRRVLIVLENVTSAAQVRAVLPAGRNCALIATSRSSLASLREAVQVTLDELAVADAWALLAGGVGAHRLEAEPEATRRVIEMCDGLPLALDIAAARLAAKPHWSMSTLAARLEDRDRLLSELRHDDLDIRSALDGGYRALAPEGRALLRKLGYFAAREISAWEASQLEAVTPAEAEARIEALIDARLLTVSGVGAGGTFTYRCPAMVLAHARERALAEDPVAELDAAVGRVLAGVGGGSRI